MRMTAVLLLVAAVLVGCSTPDAAEPTPTESTGATPTRAAEPPPDPPNNRCYQLGFEEALAPEQPEAADRPCGKPHASETYRVAQLDLVVDGHQVAVDSPQVQDQAARRCPEGLPEFLGTDQAGLRLSMVRPIWFTPTLEQSDAGSQWLRCDAVVVSGDQQLATSSGSLRNGFADGVPDRYAMCGTAAPDAPGFERVVCSADHGWRAVSVVGFEAQQYPGRDAARQRGQQTCEDVGADEAEDPLDYRWSYEWPTAEQWQAGMTFGRCWVPD
ncbi:septum formation family protein [Nocardioides panacisoli]|uniref:septum formation family protein n=1 Tax=Nocardioides panacisoli TaxID=627624 RepID=UPI001C62DB69|nr:septum formation family protein [Nocardioides panacisoli]QYJ05530.1 septum formation family protein [Nocardioides panacisoli]